MLGYKLYTSLVPAVAEYIANEIPREIYEKIGESSLQSFDQDEFSATSLPVSKQNDVTRLHAALLEKLALSPEKYQLHFRQWQEQMNAFALMDGSIVLSDQLVLNLQSEQQLEAVILHEIGHIEHNHLMENTIRVSLFYMILSFVFGDVSVVSDLLIEGSMLGVSFSYSREFEEEADHFASQHLIALYGNANALTDALDILHQHSKDQGPSWLSTHPSLEERKAKLSNE